MRRVLLTLLLLLLTLSLAARADNDKPLRVANERYYFAFTVEPGTKVTYEKDGVGFSSTHVPPGAEKADYGLLVYGSPAMHLDAEDAAAAKLPAEETMLQASSFTDAAKWATAFKAIMVSRGNKVGGDATVKTAGGSVKVPYATWQQSFAGKTRHALMYVALHGDSFVYVQVESSSAFNKAQLDWLTTKLELLKPPAPKAAPAARAKPEPQTKPAP
jgi:hypothetical protein